MEIETRFPMFGGWQTQFYIGYSIPTGDTSAIAIVIDVDIVIKACITRALRMIFDLVLFSLYCFLVPLIFFFFPIPFLFFSIPSFKCKICQI